MALREIIARFGFSFDNRGLAKANKGIEGAIGNLRTFGAVIAGSAIVRGVANFVSEVSSAGDNLAKTSKQLGVSSKALQQWRFAASQSGAATAELDTGIRVLSRNAFTAAETGGEAGRAFDKLGVELKDTNGNLRNADVLMRDVGGALARVESATERTAIAQQLFGRSGAKLIPLFTQGEEALDALLRQVDELGGGFAEELLPLAESARDRFGEFELAMTSLKSTIALAVLPPIIAVTRSLAKGVAAISKFIGRTNVLQSLLVTLGIVFRGLLFANVVKFGGALLRLARVIAVPLAKVALLFLIVDDLIALFEGRASVIGAVLDKLFGKGSAATLIRELKAIGSALTDLIFNFGEVNVSVDGFVTDNETRFTKLASSIASATDQIVKDFAEAWEFAKADLAEFADAVPGILATIPGLIVDQIAEWVSAAMDLGSAVIDGIVEGIASGAVAVIDALGSVVSGAVDAAKKKLGISSPSKVAAAEVGGPFIQGIATGALDAARAAARTTASAVEAATALAAPRAISAPARGATGGGSMGGVVFKSDVSLTVHGSATDPQIQKLRQGLRSELRDNRRATLDALTQAVEVPA